MSILPPTAIHSHNADGLLSLILGVLTTVLFSELRGTICESINLGSFNERACIFKFLNFGLL